MLTQSVARFHGHGEATNGQPTPAETVDLAAADSTGFACDRASRHFVKRRSHSANSWQTMTYRRFGKLGIVVDCANHLILATHRGMGPRPDVDQMWPLLDGFCENAVPTRLLADAGYDSEANHELLREYLEIDSLIPAAIGRPTDKLPAGKWRCLMAMDFDEDTYGQRWQVETVMFMLKQHQGAALTARKHQTRRREMG